MQRSRKLLAVLTMAAVVTVLLGSVSASSATPVPIRYEPTAPPPPAFGPGTNTGEPDAGSSRNQPGTPAVRQGNPSVQRAFGVRALEVARWTSLMWAKRVLGVSH